MFNNHKVNFMGNYQIIILPKGKEQSGLIWNRYCGIKKFNMKEISRFWASHFKCYLLRDSTEVRRKFGGNLSMLLSTQTSHQHWSQNTFSNPQFRISPYSLLAAHAHGSLETIMNSNDPVSICCESQLRDATWM